MTHSIHNTPSQVGMSYGPPGAPPDEDTGKSKIHYQPDYTTHRYPVDERNHNNPVPSVMLPCLYNESKYDCCSQAWITQWVDKIDNPPEPISVCLQFQFTLLWTPPLVRQA